MVLIEEIKIRLILPESLLNFEYMSALIISSPHATSIRFFKSDGIKNYKIHLQSEKNVIQ